jgi:hypothetical protein
VNEQFGSARSRERRHRLHTYTRWPNDLTRRIEFADTDIAFADAMTKIMGGCDELRKIASVAFRIKCDAKDEALRQASK